MPDDLPPPGIGPAEESDWVSEPLRSLPPLAMPEQVWERLQRALAAEAATTVGATAGSSATADPVEDTTVVPMRRRARWVPALLAGAAAAVAVGVIIPRLGGGPAPVVQPGPDTGGSAAAVLAAPTIDVLPAHYVVASGTDYASATLPDQVIGVLGSVGMREPEQVVAQAAVRTIASTPAPVGSDGMTADFTTLHDCVAAFAGGGDKPPALVVDRARFAGQDAAVIVLVQSLSSDRTSATLQVVVVRPTCTDADRAAAEQILLRLPAS